jgi:hypothetical protein
VVKTVGQESVESLLASVTARAVTAIVPERNSVSQHLVSPNTASHRASHLRHLNGMSQPSALMVGRENHHLSLASQPPKRAGMHYPVAVALKASALSIWSLWNRPIPRPMTQRRPSAQSLRLNLFALLAPNRSPNSDLRRRISMSTHHFLAMPMHSLRPSQRPSRSLCLIHKVKPATSHRQLFRVRR